MSSAQVRRFAEWRAQQGRPVRSVLSMREQAKRLREHAARLRADAAELDAVADFVGEPELPR